MVPGGGPKEETAVLEGAADRPAVGSLQDVPAVDPGKEDQETGLRLCAHEYSLVWMDTRVGTAFASPPLPSPFSLKSCWTKTKHGRQSCWKMKVALEEQKAVGRGTRRAGAAHKGLDKAGAGAGGGVDSSTAAAQPYQMLTTNSAPLTLLPQSGLPHGRAAWHHVV